MFLLFCYMLLAMGQGHKIACKLHAIVMVIVEKCNCIGFIEDRFVNALYEYFLWRGENMW